ATTIPNGSGSAPASGTTRAGPAGSGWTGYSTSPRTVSAGRAPSCRADCSTGWRIAWSGNTTGAESSPGAAGSGLQFPGPPEQQPVQQCTEHTTDQREHDERPQLPHRPVLVGRHGQAAGRVHRGVVDRDRDQVDERESETERHPGP